MFVLLYEDKCLNRMTVLDTSDGVVETMDTMKVLGIMTERDIPISGILRVGAYCCTEEQPYPVKERKTIPSSCFLIDTINITKREYDRTIAVTGFQVKDWILDRTPKSIVLKDDTNLSKFFFSQSVYVHLNDLYSSESYTWTIMNGKCMVFKDANYIPYNANMGTEVSEEMLGDFICKFLAKGYVDIREIA